MEDRSRPFADVHARTEQRRIDVPHGKHGEGDVGVRGQEHRDLDAATRGRDQRAQHLSVGQEVTMREMDVAARAAHGFEVTPAQPPTAAPVGEMDPDGAGTSRWPLVAQLAGEPVASEAAHLHGEIGPTRDVALDAIFVAHVDAADEGYAVVDEEQLAVVPGQRAAKKCPEAFVDPYLTTGGGQLGAHRGSVSRRAPGIEGDAHPDAATRRRRQSCDEAKARRIATEEVDLKVYALARFFDGRDHSRE